MPPQGEGWVALFDGDPEDLDDWREATDIDPSKPDVDHFEINIWKVVDGILTHENWSGENHTYYEGPALPMGPDPTSSLRRRWMVRSGTRL